MAKHMVLLVGPFELGFLRYHVSGILYNDKTHSAAQQFCLGFMLPRALISYRLGPTTKNTVPFVSALELGF